MSDILIQHSHQLDHTKAISEAEQLLEELSREYGVGIEQRAEGQYAFSGSGVNGTVQITPAEIVVEARLGFLAMAIKPVLEEKITAKLKQHFS